MFGMTIEKIVVVLVLAAIIVGPQRLPGYAHRLAGFIRGVRAYTDAARTRLETEVGVPLAVEEWQSLDPRRYDPRRIVREALAAPSSAPTAETLAETAGIHGRDPAAPTLSAFSSTEAARRESPRRESTSPPSGLAERDAGSAAREDVERTDATSTAAATARAAAIRAAAASPGGWRPAAAAATGD